MRDQLLGCEFDISPTAFYQTNPQQTELLYQLAIDGMDLRQGDVLMDAYCGSGTIGLCAAKDAQNKGIGIMLLGVERNPAGIADARRNAELNGLTRSAWFMADDATDYILDAADNNERIDVLSIDPPRAGSTPEFLEAACALKPRRLPMAMPMWASVDTPMPTPSSAQRSAILRHTAQCSVSTPCSRLWLLISIILCLALAANSTSSISNGTPERPVWPSMNTLGCSRALIYISVVWASVAPSAICGLCTLATK